MQPKYGASKNTIDRSRVPAALVLFIFVVGFASGYAWNDDGTVANSSPVTAAGNNFHFSEIFSSIGQEGNVGLQNMKEIWRILDTKYVEPADLDLNAMGYGAARGFVEGAGDPYTAYMSPDEAEEFQISLGGELEGIGAEVGMRDGLVTIITPLRGSPAEAAGLLPDDVIAAIDGEPTEAMSLHEAVLRIRGERGTRVTLRIFREGVEEPLDITIKRDKITIESVTHEEIEPGIFLISVNQFSDQTPAEFRKAIDAVLLGDAKGVILDLRFNGGGFLDISVDMVSEFIVGEKKAVTVAKRNEQDNEIFNTNGKPRLPDVPLVVLVNGGSASASEIVAGAIQDFNRGIIMGTQTFGKGSVQEVETLKDGSLLRVTIAKWLTPNGYDIDGVGITPNRIIEDINPADDADIQLQTAIDYLRRINVS